MAKSSTKNKSPLLTFVIVLVLLIFFYNFDEIMAGLDSDSDPYDNEPGVSLDGSGTGTPELETISEAEKEILFAAVPEHLRSNYFLTYKEQGCCKSLTGSVYVTVVMISDSVSTWDDISVSNLQTALGGYAENIVSEAADHNASVSFTFGYHHASLSGDICSGDYSNDWQDPALESAGLPVLSEIHDHITGTYQVKEAPVVFVFNKESRAYASVGNSEFLALFSNDDFNSFRHELSHVFGAKDFYYPDEVENLAETYFPDSVMNSGETADPLTAYLIGWTDTLADSAISFLENTNTITAEYMDQQSQIESFTGNGTKVFDFGTYTGDLVRGVCHGTGTMNYNNGGWYTGSWVNGSWSGDGSGKYIYSDGSTYEGAFKNGNRHGTGTYTYADGAVYTGSWADGERNGTGTMYYADGGWYTGGWSNGNWSGTGSGKYIYDDGSTYEGAFKNGKRHGTGTYTYADGAAYTGSWADGKLNGTGTMYYADGGWYTGNWSNGSKSGTGTGKEIYDNGAYEGAFLNGQRHGQGTYTWTNGDTYTGQWVNGDRTGYGTYTWADGSSQSGNWQNGKFIG